jgi:ribonucleoside-diphosphate reductase alpha chain
MTRLTRPLGLGYCNLGAFLMAAGLPYDSREARTLAFGITSLLTATAYHRSAEIARDHGGPFTAYHENRETMLNVLEGYAQSATESGKIRSHVHAMDEVLAGALEQTWAETLDMGRLYGYRNDEVTCLAPTGTIQFLMAASTTGCEPDIALVKYKTLAGGGTLKIVNQTVPVALRKLGYAPEQVQAMTAFVDAHDTIEGAPGLKSEHLSVFDCAFKAQNGTRFISWQGHVEMMAALQEGVSMAISKTVNMPNSATREDVLSAYTLAWDLGVKALAVFRDGSKGVQVVSTGTGGDKTEAENMAHDPPTLAPRATRTMSGSRTKIGIGGMDGYVRTSHDADGRIVEVFLTFSKHGSTVGGLMDALAVMISKDLRRGVSLSEILDSIRWGSFVPQGWTTIETSDGKSENMPSSSVVNAVCAWLMAEYPDGVWVGSKNDPGAKILHQTVTLPVSVAADGPAPKFCGNCGSVKVPNGPRCWTCSGCGDKEGGCG